MIRDSLLWCAVILYILANNMPFEKCSYLLRFRDALLFQRTERMGKRAKLATMKKSERVGMCAIRSIISVFFRVNKFTLELINSCSLQILYTFLNLIIYFYGYIFQTSNQLLGPKPFPLDRLMAIFYSIVEGKVAPTANVFSQVSVGLVL